MSSPSLLDGGGEMGALMRAIDWSRTPLGPTGQWPQSLRPTVSTCLNSRFPILVWWGPQFVKLYNDAYLQMLDRIFERFVRSTARATGPTVVSGLVSRS